MTGDLLCQTFPPSGFQKKYELQQGEGEKCVRVVFLERQPLLLSGNNILLLVFPDMTDKGHVCHGSQHPMRKATPQQRDRMIQEQHQVTKGQKGQIMRWRF